MFQSMAFGYCLPMKNFLYLSQTSHGLKMHLSKTYAGWNGLPKIIFIGLRSMLTYRLNQFAIHQPFHWSPA